MAIDRHEAKVRGQLPKKGGTKHPFAAIEHRVIDSPAYADLTFSARSLLQLLARQLTVPNNNGHLQATHSYMARFGFSDRTLTRAIKELISHGIVYRTRCGGYQQGASQYAVSWLSIDKKAGLFLDGFLPCAWRHWEPSKNKTPPAKLRYHNRKNGDRTLVAQAKFTASRGCKFTDNELMPVGVVKKHLYRLVTTKQERQLNCSYSPRRPLKAGKGLLRLVA